MFARTDDYEAVPKLDNYKHTHLFDDVQYDIAGYSLPMTSNNASTTVQYSTLMAVLGETPLEDEQIYKDPGYKIEKIYEWFKQRNVCELGKNSIR